MNVQSFSNLSSANSLGGAYRVESTDQWSTVSGVTIKFHCSVTGQLRGSRMRSSSMAGCIQHILKLENVVRQ